jgi:thiol-disulfide isomerase/thioredoxin
LYVAVLGGLIGIDELKNPDKANDYLWAWLNSEVDEDFRKDELLDFCSVCDKYNQLLIENQKLKEHNAFLIKEVTKIAIESVNRSKQLAKLEAEIKRRMEEFNPCRNKDRHRTIYER